MNLTQACRIEACVEVDGVAGSVELDGCVDAPREGREVAIPARIIPHLEGPRGRACLT